MEEGPARPPVRPSLLSTRMVGRESELAVLGGALAAAVDGRGSVAFVLGEAGIGKSRLAQALAADAQRQGIAVLRGRAVPAAAPIAYRPLTEALCSAARSDLVPAVPELVPFRPLLGRLVPEWRSEEVGVDESVVALAEAVLRCLRAIAGDRGCLVVLEDLHWSDAETLAILEYLGDNLVSERVLCVATMRDERCLGLDVARALHARRASELVELRRLERGEVAEMLRSCLGTDDVGADVVALAARADGVPFLVEELLVVAAASGALVSQGRTWSLSGSVEPVVPLTFADSVRRRMADLDEAARSVLLAAAVLGRRFRWEVIPAMTLLDEGCVLAALQAAVDTHVVAIDPEGAGFRFRHALSRDAVLAQLLPPERARLSRRALDAIGRSHPGLPGEWCVLATELAEGAGDRARAAALLLERGRRDLDRGALATAEATLDRARLVAPAGDPVLVDVEESLARVLSLAGKRDGAIEVGESLLTRLGHGSEHAARRGEAHLVLARAAVAATDWNEAERLLGEAAAEAAIVDDQRLRARIDALSAQVAIMRGPERAAALAFAALEAAEHLGLPEVACEALEVLGRVERQRDLDVAEAAFGRAHAIAVRCGITVWQMRALHELGTIDLLREGDLTRLEEARELASAQGALATAAVLDIQLAAGLSLRTGTELCLAPARRAAELARRYHLDQVLAAALGFEAHSHARSGRRGEMERCLDEAAALGGAMPGVDVIAEIARGIAAFVEEDRPAARRHLVRAVVPAAEASGDQATGPASGMWALVSAVDADADQTAPTWPVDEPVHFLARGLLRYAEAVLAGRSGDEEAAGAAMARGDRQLGGHGWWYRQYGRRLVAEAALADGWGEPVEWLREALAFFGERREARIAGACRSLLRSAGAAVPRRRGEASAPGPLRAAGVTDRELEVLQLLAQGLPNKEIAARLYLSPRTVERHIANVGPKVGALHRAQLVAFAARTLGGEAPA